MSLSDQLVGDVGIVGYRGGQTKIAVSHRNITTREFMKAHVEDNSELDGPNIPPFYFPAPHLNLRQVLGTSDLEKALATVCSHAVQENMEKEQKQQRHEAPQLQDFCPTGSYISMVITYPRRGRQLSSQFAPIPKPELEGLQCVSIGNRRYGFS
ncbi:hypothetical protein DFQ27_000965 [Actinomortierella ambigua]|uniref:Uncharacterized protein n=1 Tax=Actinomortierella ambigua TaxID=1343610 RepID=A0A9P6U966_9FUNG|nr:hypothetical protein DFQ27_000965 [Actinomortierella ambigua]